MQQWQDHQNIRKTLCLRQALTRAGEHSKPPVIPLQGRRDVNSGNRIAKTTREISVTVLVLGLMSGCSNLPSLDEVKSVSLNSDFSASNHLVVDVDGDPEMHPGKMAMDGFKVAGECEFCIFLIPVTVPLMATIGAVVTATETLPTDQARDLNRVTANAMASLNLAAEFSEAMRGEAMRRGIKLGSKRVDARLDIVMTKIEWDVSVGNNVAIRIDFRITGRAGGKSGHRKITYQSERIKASVWLADSGQQIRETLAQIADDASKVVWQRLLDREEEIST